MAGLSTVAMIAGIAGTAIQAVGTIASGRQQARALEQQATLLEQRGEEEAAALEAKGKAEAEAAEFEAGQLDVAAREEKAAAQRDMLDLRRNKQLALSKLVNLAAGSGFTATDPTALNLAADIEKYGTLQELSALYGGESRARGLKESAKGLRFSGQSGLSAAAASAAGARTSSLLSAGAARESARAERTGSYLSAGKTILGGVSTMADRYARRPYQAPSTAYSYWYG